MIYDHAPSMTPPALHAPEDVPAKRRGRTKSRRTTTALAIGTIILLENGRACKIVAFDRNNQPLCVPVAPQP